MKSLKAIGAALVLALSLSLPASADGTTDPGDGHTPGVPCNAATSINPCSTDVTSDSDKDISLLTIAILQALTSIY